MTTQTPADAIRQTAWDNRPGPLTVIDDVLAELARAEKKFPDQHLPDGTGPHVVLIGGRAEHAADWARLVCQKADAAGTATWRHVLTEEVFEALAEEDSALLRAELVQVAAMSIRWIRDIDLREVTA